MKKFRPFWSYRLESTERWIEQMAMRGYKLQKMTRGLRIFTFEQQPKQQIHAKIQYKGGKLASRLEQDGWHINHQSGPWKVLENQQASPKSYPEDDDAAFKRLRLHTYLYIFLAMWFIPMQFGMMSLLAGGALFSIIPIITYIFLVVLTGYVFKQYRQQNIHSMPILETRKKGAETITKMRPAWMYLPYQTKRLLADMANKGYTLQRVQAAFFTFEKTNETVAYELVIERSKTARYYEMHQQLGWQVKATSGIGWLRYTIWMMPYEAGDEVPALTYDLTERKHLLKKSFITNFLFAFFLLIICLQSLYNLLQMNNGGFSIMLVFSIFVTGLWLTIISKIVFGYVRERSGYDKIRV